MEPNAEAPKQAAPEELDKQWDKVAKDRADEAPADAQPAGDGIAATEAKADDPLAGLPEPTRKLIESLQSKVGESETRFKDMGQKLATAHGTIGNLKQRLDESQAKLTQIEPVVKTVTDAEKAKVDAAAQEKLAKRKALRERLEDLPDIAELYDMVFDGDGKPPKVDEKPVEPGEQQIDRGDVEPPKHMVEALREALEERCPGWESKRTSQPFKDWLAAQTDEVKGKLGSWKVSDSASVIEAFDKHVSDSATVSAVEKERQERLRRGESVQGRGGGGKGADGGDPDALWNKVARDRERERTGAT